MLFSFPFRQWPLYSDCLRAFIEPQLKLVVDTMKSVVTSVLESMHEEDLQRELGPAPCSLYMGELGDHLKVFRTHINHVEPLAESLEALPSFVNFVIEQFFLNITLIRPFSELARARFVKDFLYLCKSLNVSAVFNRFWGAKLLLGFCFASNVCFAVGFLTGSMLEPDLSSSVAELQGVQVPEPAEGAGRGAGAAGGRTAGPAPARLAAGPPVLRDPGTPTALRVGRLVPQGVHGLVQRAERRQSPRLPGQHGAGAAAGAARARAGPAGRLPGRVPGQTGLKSRHPTRIFITNTLFNIYIVFSGDLPTVICNCSLAINGAHKRETRLVREFSFRFFAVCI